VSLSDEEILFMVNEVYDGPPWGGWTPDQITAFTIFARLIQQKQREADAALCDRFTERMMNLAEAAAAIRSQKP
jgi:hypothetical protein